MNKITKTEFISLMMGEGLSKKFAQRSWSLKPDWFDTDTHTKEEMTAAIKSAAQSTFKGESLEDYRIRIQKKEAA